MRRFAAACLMTTILALPVYPQKIVSQIAAKVNKDIILVSEIKKAENELRAELIETSKLKGAQLQQAIAERSKDILRDLIDKYLILQEANDLGLDANLDVLKQIEQMRLEYNFPTDEALEAAMLKQGTSIDEVKENIRYKNLRSQVMRRDVTGRIVITTEEMRNFYEANKQSFDRPPFVSIGIIAVSTEGLSTAQTEAKNKDMADALAALRKGEDFGDWARKISEDPSAHDGGALPPFDRSSDGSYGLASPEMEDIVKKLAKGKITDVMSNPANHTLIILKLLDRHDGGILPFETAQGEIYSNLMDERAEPRVRAFLTKLRAEGYVEVYPGFVDTGAATKAVKASETSPPKD